MSNTAVYGIFKEREQVETAGEALLRRQFREADISVLFPQNEGSKDFAHKKHSKAPEGAVSGGGSGAIVGGALGWLAGIGALAIPGVGPLVAAGPILSMLAGVGAGGLAGGFIGALIGVGIPEYEAKRYEGRIKQGGILMSVHCDNPDWVKKARQVLRDAGAVDIASASEANADYGASDKPLPRRVRSNA